MSYERKRDFFMWESEDLARTRGLALGERRREDGVVVRHFLLFEREEDAIVARLLAPGYWLYVDHYNKERMAEFLWMGGRLAYWCANNPNIPVCFCGTPHCTTDHYNTHPGVGSFPDNYHPSAAGPGYYTEDGFKRRQLREEGGQGVDTDEYLEENAETV